MYFETWSHRNGEEIAETVPDYRNLWEELKDAIASISEADLIAHFQANHEHKQKSVSKSINSLLKDRLESRGWTSEPRIFGEKGYSDKKRDKKWRLDFSKSVSRAGENNLENSLEPEAGIAVEVAFNNDGSTAWNLIKPVLSSELNHVKKEIQTGMGVIITVTESLKRDGGFDSTVGTFDDFKMHLRPMRNILTVPMIVIGLSTFDTFDIEVYLDKANKKRGKIRLL